MNDFYLTNQSAALITFSIVSLLIAAAVTFSIESKCRKNLSRFEKNADWLVATFLAGQGITSIWLASTVEHFLITGLVGISGICFLFSGLRAVIRINHS